jgi:hypothetical protein
MKLKMLSKNRNRWPIKGDWKLFLEAGGWIGGLSDEYSKLYKV